MVETVLLIYDFACSPHYTATDIFFMQILFMMIQIAVCYFSESFFVFGAGNFPWTNR